MPPKALQTAPAAFQQWCRTLALPDALVSSLSTIRRSQPVRRVTSRAGNVSGNDYDPPLWRERAFCQNYHKLVNLSDGVAPAA